MPASHETLRLATWSVGAVLLIYVMMILFQSRERPWLDAAKIWFPVLVATVPLYLFIIWRLSGRPADTLGLGLAAVGGAFAFALPFIYATLALNGEGHWAGIALFVFIVTWHITALTIVVLFLPLQAKMAMGALKALMALDGARTLPALAGGVLMLLAYMAVTAPIVKPLLAASEATARKSEYSQQAAEQHLVKVYTCLWKVGGAGAERGFPESEATLRQMGAECWDPVVGPDGSGYGTGYAFRYEPGPADASGVIRSFGIATRKRAAPGAFADSRFLDETGITRQASEGWATRKTERLESAMRSEVPEIMGALDAWHDLRGAYPARLISRMRPDSAGADDMILHEQVFSSRDVTNNADGSSTIENSRGPIVYTPVFGSAGTGGAIDYRISIRGDFRSVSTMRSYVFGSDGRIHATGEPRDATEADPLAPEQEFTLRWREQKRANVGQFLRRAP